MSFRIVIPAPGRDATELTEALAWASVEGIEEREAEWLVYFASREEALRVAEECGGGEPEEIRDENWSAVWQADWRPLRIGRRFYLTPPGYAGRVPRGRIPLAMVPGNVFGGGDHPTTQLCLELLESLVRPGGRVADIGAGTGILTRAVRGLGGHAVGCDIDRASAGMVDFLGSADALRAGAFDLVIANIHLGVLRELRPDLVALGRPGGRLLLSGFLPEQRKAVTELFGRPERVKQRGGWCAAVFPLGGG